MIIIGEKNLEKGEIEYKSRRSGEKQMVDKQQLVKFITEKLQ
jgi:prolyl-tRNA synthetase